MQLQVWRSWSQGLWEQPNYETKRKKEVNIREKNKWEKDREYRSHFDCLILPGLPLACGPSASVKTKSPGIWDSGKPTLLWTMTQGANFKYADWSISSISQSRRWSSFPLPVSLSCLSYSSLPYSLTSFLISSFHLLLFLSPSLTLFSSRFLFGADKSKMLSSVSGPMCLDTEPQS